MSVIVKRMKMPKSCNKCTFGDGYACYATGRTVQDEDWEITRSASCPLVELPPHGRLIDADALMNEMDKQENAMYEHGHEFTFSFKSGGDICTAWYNVEFMVEDAPTILEAEVEEP